MSSVRRPSTSSGRGPGGFRAPELMLDECSWGVRSYYRIWARLPQMADGLTGAGVYGVSEAGRSRFAAFPDVIADDTYITCLFAPGERKRITSVSSTVRPSRSFRELVATRVRVHLGILQVRRRQVQEGSRTGSGGHAGWLQVIRREPPLVFDLPAYLAVTAWAKLLAGRRLGRQRDLWARAETSRAHHGDRASPATSCRQWRVGALSFAARNGSNLPGCGGWSHRGASKCSYWATPEYG